MQRILIPVADNELVFSEALLILSNDRIAVVLIKIGGFRSLEDTGKLTCLQQVFDLLTQDKGQRSGLQDLLLKFQIPSTSAHISIHS